LAGLRLGESPLLTALVLAAVLGLRHATDPDHVLAVTALVAGDRGDVRAGARIGASWGVGHAAVLVLVGLPLIALGAASPAWLESGAEQLVGLVILAMACDCCGAARGRRAAQPCPSRAPRPIGRRPAQPPSARFTAWPAPAP
jgi:hypothetical protein